MGSVQKGAQRVGSFRTQLARLGYRTKAFSASGQTKASRKDENPLQGDGIAFAPEGSFGLPHVLFEVGGIGKNIGRALEELETGGLPPGFIAIVARCVKRRWKFSTWQGTYGDLQLALREGSA